uniref:Odorant receptor n=1 Tax=Eucryptorrhynchus scrobiculatus TaxID=1552824 RepID=A0A8F4RRB0_EUCSC|nr:odorant receptor 29 [Eucryptorrhynchus scrobiculatus]
MGGGQFMRYTKCLMLASGIWPMRYLKNPILHMLYRFWGILLQTLHTTGTVTMWTEFFYLLGMNDMKKLTDNIRTGISCFLVVIKVFIFQSARFTKVLNHVIEQERIFSNSEDEEIRKLHLNSAKYVRTFAKLIAGLVYSTALLLIVSTYVAGMKVRNDPLAEKPAILLVRLPFDQNEYYGTALFLQASFVVLFSILYGMTQVLYISIMVFAKMRLHILQHQIRNFDYYKRMSLVPVDDIGMMKRLIRDHQTVIRFVGDLNEAIRLMLLVEFLFSSLNIATAVFQLISDQNLNDSLFSLQCILLIIGQLLVLVWHADVINVESVNVASALYEFPWYEKSVEIQKMAHIMTIRAQRPLRLTIGPFKPLTNQIISQVINVAYSYITIMTRD